MHEEFDPEEMFPPTKYVKHRRVAVFDEHESTGAGGKPKAVTVSDLKAISKTCNEKFARLGVATPLTLGHTKDEADEEDQPKIVGWACNFDVDDLAKSGRKALFCDWYIKKKYENVIDEYPHRSVEYWKSRQDLNPIALMRSTADRDLPIIRYDREDEVYRYVYQPSNQVSPSELRNMDNNESKVVADAVAQEGSAAKQDNTEIAQLKEQVNKLTSLMTDLMQMLQSEGNEDGGEDAQPEDDNTPSDDDEGTENLLDSMGDGSERPTPDEDGGEAGTDGGSGVEAPSKKAADEEDEPEQYAANAGPDNTYIPGMEKKTKMSRTNDDVLKYERKVAELEKNYEELAVKYNRTQAEKAVASLETDHNIDFGSPEDREEEVSIFTKLLTVNKTGDSFKKHFDKVAKKYKRKDAVTPDSKGAGDALKYARTENDNKPGIASTEDLQNFLKARAEDASLTPSGWAAKRNGVK